MSWKNTPLSDKSIYASIRKDSIAAQTNGDTTFFTMKMIVSLENNIAPIIYVPDNFNKTLSKLPHEEAEQMRRKFRKLWRKLARDIVRAERAKKRAARRTGTRPLPRCRSFQALGVGYRNADPNCDQKSKRKLLMMLKIDTIAHDLVLHSVGGDTMT